MSATPLLFTGLAAAVAFRMQLFNIGAEGQLYIGAICGAGAAIWLGPHHGDRRSRSCSMCACAAAGGRALGADRRRAQGVRADERDHHHADAQLRRRAAAHVPDLRQRLALARRLDGAGAIVPAGGPARGRPVLARLDAVRHRGPARLPARDRRRGRADVPVPLDPVRLRDERDRRLAAGGPLRGDAHAPEDPGGDGPLRRRSPGSAAPARSATSRTSLDASPQGLQGANYGYTGIVVAALGRYNPFAVCLVGVLLGGLQNAGLFLQGADFPSGLVGVMQGIILFCALGGELLIRYRVRFGAASASRGGDAGRPRPGRRRDQQLVPRHRARAGGRSTARRSSSPRSASCSPSAPGCSTSASRG